MSDGNGAGNGLIRLWRPALYEDPIRGLCEKAGGLTQEQWKTYAAGETFIEAC